MTIQEISIEQFQKYLRKQWSINEGLRPQLKYFGINTQFYKPLKIYSKDKGYLALQIQPDAFKNTTEKKVFLKHAARLSSIENFKMPKNLKNSQGKNTMFVVVITEVKK